MWYLPRPLLHQCNRFFFRLKHIAVNINEVVGKFIVTLGEQPGKNVQVVNAIKHNSFIFCKLIFTFYKFIRHFSVVHARAKMMDDMITIIPAFVIVHSIDAVDGAGI